MDKSGFPWKLGVVKKRLFWLFGSSRNMVSCLETRQKFLTSRDNARWDIVEEENLLQYTPYCAYFSHASSRRILKQVISFDFFGDSFCFLTSSSE